MTPTTDRVREIYSFFGYRQPEDSGFRKPIRQRRNDFDRWLASEKAAALREMADTMLLASGPEDVLKVVRQEADFIRQTADSMETNS